MTVNATVARSSALTFRRTVAGARGDGQDDGNRADDQMLPHRRLANGRQMVRQGQAPGRSDRRRIDGGWIGF
jgi:hypothetical protein